MMKFLRKLFGIPSPSKLMMDKVTQEPLTEEELEQLAATERKRRLWEGDRLPYGN